jgi:CBS-domain-containing membrane protein
MSLPERADLHQRLLDRYGSKGEALYMLVGGLLTIPVNGFAAYFSGLPLFFPSLSPTVVALFRQPLSEQGSPRNTVSEQLVAAAVGLVCSLCVRPGRRAEHLAGGRNAPAHWPLRPRWR